MKYKTIEGKRVWSHLTKISLFMLIYFTTPACVPAQSLTEHGFAASPQTKMKKVVLIAGKKSHAPGDHEYEKGVKLLKECLDNSPNVKGIQTEVYLNGWPDDFSVLDNADTILFFSDGSDRDEQAHPLLHGNRLETLSKLMKHGVGLVAIHYTVFVPTKKAGDQFLLWIGGYFDYENGPAPKKWYSQIKTQDYAMLPASAMHPIAHGLQPFQLREEFYFNIRFAKDHGLIVPILTFATNKDDPTKVVAWAFERKDRGRGFAFTGGHFHRNWWDEHMRRMVLNAILWTAKVDVPAGGVKSSLPAFEDSAEEQNRSESKPIRALIVTGHNRPRYADGTPFFFASATLYP